MTVYNDSYFMFQAGYNSRGSRMNRTDKKSARAVWNHIKGWRGCTRCEIGRHAFYHVFFRGSVPAPLLFIGIGPGKTEDVVGKPFVGKAGKVLDALLADVGLGQRDYCLTNLVLCRPCDGPGQPNRDPTLEEMHNCSPRLTEFMELVNPRAFVLLGEIATVAVLPQVRDSGKPVCGLYHPSYIARNGGAKSKAFRDTANELNRFLRKVL